MGRKRKHVEIREQVAALVEANNATIAVAILGAKRGELAKRRREAGVEKPVQISTATACKLAREAGVELKRGNRSDNHAGGRKPKYVGEEAAKIVALVKEYNASKAMEILNSPNSPIGLTKAQRGYRKIRKDLGFSSPLGISMGTVLKLAHEAGVELKRGNRTNHVNAGRSPKFVGEEASKIVALVEEYNASQAVEILAANRGELAKVRKNAGFQKPVSVSLPTVLKLAHEAGVEVKRGKPAA